jgi:amino acid permease
MGLITAMIWNATERTNTTNNGMIKEFIDVMIFFDLFEDAVMNSLEDNIRIRRMATNTPPIPILIAVVMVTALVAAAVAVALVAAAEAAVVIAVASISLPCR